MPTSRPLQWAFLTLLLTMPSFSTAAPLYQQPPMYDSYQIHSAQPTKVDYLDDAELQYHTSTIENEVVARSMVHNQNYNDDDQYDIHESAPTYRASPARESDDLEFDQDTFEPSKEPYESRSENDNNMDDTDSHNKREQSTQVSQDREEEVDQNDDPPYEDIRHEKVLRQDDSTKRMSEYQDENSNYEESYSVQDTEPVDGSDTATYSNKEEVDTPESATAAASPDSEGGTNIKHLGEMVLKLIKQYNVKSVADFPCRNTLDWFPSLLHKIDFEIPGFSYYCVDDEPTKEDIRPLFGAAGAPQFIGLQPEQSKKLPEVDMVFSWGGPQKWGVERSWQFFSALRDLRPDYILVSNNAIERNCEEEKGINIRKQPFHFDRALRVISDVDTGEPAKHLLLYEIDGIRKGF